MFERESYRYTARTVGSMSSSFHNADMRTHRRVILTGLLFCTVFMVVSFYAGKQPDNNYVVVKADKLVRAAGTPLPAE
jgi:hypothetical protein